MPLTSWKPLIQGALAEEVEAALTAIAETLETSPPDAQGFSLSTGYSGIALFFGYLSSARSDEGLAEEPGCRPVCITFR
jgi:hypothetical protein